MMHTSDAYSYHVTYQVTSYKYHVSSTMLLL